MAVGYSVRCSNCRDVKPSLIIGSNFLFQHVGLLRVEDYKAITKVSKLFYETSEPVQLSVMTGRWLWSHSKEDIQNSLLRKALRIEVIYNYSAIKIWAIVNWVFCGFFLRKIMFFKEKITHLSQNLREEQRIMTLWQFLSQIPGKKVT